MPLLIYKWQGQQRPNFDGFIYIHYAAPPYSARISAIYLLSFGKVGWVLFVVCNAWQRSRTENLRKVGSSSSSSISSSGNNNTKIYNAHIVKH